MSTAVAKLPEVNVRSLNTVQSENGLIGLATPIIELILQLKSNRIEPSHNLRNTFSELFKQLAQQSEALGYRDRSLQSIKFALCAFIDETVLTADFPLRDEWEKFPLQLEYFGEQLAGVTYFERLDQLLKETENNADEIEVYYLCLLIGFKGKYKIYLEDQLKGVIENVADHLRRANRLRAGALSPHWQVTDQPAIIVDKGWPRWLKIGGSLAVGFTLLSYLILKFLLASHLFAAKSQLLR